MKYWQEYSLAAQRPDHSTQAAESINTTITSFKESKLKLFEINGGRLSREQRAARLKENI